MTGTVVHVELNTPDPAVAREFYSGLFGWKPRELELGGGAIYTFMETPGGARTAIQQAMPDAPTLWLSYVRVKSVRSSIAKAKRLGATIAVDYVSVSGHGALGIFVDPTGAAMGVWEDERVVKVQSSASFNVQKKAEAKKAPVQKKAVAKKAPAKKKAVAKKAPVKKKAVAKKAPVKKKAVAKKAPAKVAVRERRKGRTRR